jgi:hypothetical protein
MVTERYGDQLANAGLLNAGQPTVQVAGVSKPQRTLCITQPFVA